MYKFKWNKLGIIFKPNKHYWWMQTHAMLPTVELIDSSIYRVYFGSRNNNNQSHIGYFVIDLSNLAILEMSKSPVLLPGKLGTFDDNGVLPSSVLKINNVKYMYYIGFKPGGTTRMDLFGGLAVFNNENNLDRYSEAPIIERCKVNPYINTAPFVIENNNHKQSYKYFMYYVAGCGWVNKDLPKYNIQIAFSNDAIEWERNGQVCIDFENDNEVALARPYVLWNNGKYHMWFSYKGESYKIGYAVSEDGINWIRCDEVGGMVNSKNNNNEFDSDMVAYASVMCYQKKYFMFYNGNNYGFDGIGMAIADE
jgi:predicted GH43/DUF377 family glycosyl hydrolase